MAPTALIDELRTIVGNDGLIDRGDARHYLVDERHVFHGDAVAIVRPANTEQVARVVRCCIDHDAYVVTQGGNTGMSGGATPLSDRPNVLLLMSRMNRVEDVNPEQFTITAQAGVTVQELQECAARVGRHFAPDWGARGTATIGGAIATNAGGSNVVRHGPTRDHVLGIEAVLPDGRVWNGLRALRKDVSGYDLKQLFIGSEGTLGVITRAVVKISSAPIHHQSAFVAIPSLDAVMELFTLGLRYADDALSAIELIPDVGIDLVTARIPTMRRPLETRSEWYVLIRLASPRPIDDRVELLLSEATEAGLVTDAVLAVTAEQEANLWNLRDELPPPYVFEHHEAGLKLDTAVPIDRIPQYYDGVAKIAAAIAPTALVYAFGHIGDGNIHLTVQPNDDDLEGFAIVKSELTAAIDAYTWELGGTISAEHGIGRELLSRMSGQKADVELELMRSIKSVFDPQGRFNPGVLLPEPAEQQDAGGPTTQKDAST